jgi:hypothetical protein
LPRALKSALAMVFFIYLLLKVIYSSNVLPCS